MVVLEAAEQQTVEVVAALVYLDYVDERGNRFLSSFHAHAKALSYLLTCLLTHYTYLIRAKFSAPKSLTSLRPYEEAFYHQHPGNRLMHQI